MVTRSSHQTIPGAGTRKVGHSSHNPPTCDASPTRLLHIHQEIQPNTDLHRPACPSAVVPPNVVVLAEVDQHPAVVLVLGVPQAVELVGVPGEQPRLGVILADTGHEDGHRVDACRRAPELGVPRRDGHLLHQHFASRSWCPASLRQPASPCTISLTSISVTDLDLPDGLP